jgi:hypothetical protein
LIDDCFISNLPFFNSHIPLFTGCSYRQATYS